MEPTRWLTAAGWLVRQAGLQTAALPAGEAEERRGRVMWR